jgi:hypothetical protein
MPLVSCWLLQKVSLERLVEVLLDRKLCQGGSWIADQKESAAAPVLPLTLQVARLRQMEIAAISITWM